MLFKPLSRAQAQAAAQEYQRRQCGLQPDENGILRNARGVPMRWYVCQRGYGVWWGQYARECEEKDLPHGCGG